MKAVEAFEYIELKGVTGVAVVDDETGRPPPGCGSPSIPHPPAFLTLACMEAAHGILGP
jgi:hypothetical protein